MCYNKKLKLGAYTNRRPETEEAYPFEQKNGPFSQDEQRPVCHLSVAFIAAAIPISLPLAIGEAAAAVLVYFIGRWRRGAAQQQLTQYMERVSGGRDSAASSNLLFAPLPMMVFDLDTEAVLWSNDSFLQLSGLTDKLYESHLDDVIPDFDTHWLLEGKRESPELVTWNHRQPSQTLTTSLRRRHENLSSIAYHLAAILCRARRVPYCRSGADSAGPYKPGLPGKYCYHPKYPMGGGLKHAGEGGNLRGQHGASAGAEE